MVLQWWYLSSTAGGSAPQASGCHGTCGFPGHLSSQVISQVFLACWAHLHAARCRAPATGQCTWCAVHVRLARYWLDTWLDTPLPTAPRHLRAVCTCIQTYWQDPQCTLPCRRAGGCVNVGHAPVGVGHCHTTRHSIVTQDYACRYATPTQHWSLPMMRQADSSVLCCQPPLLRSCLAQLLGPILHL